MMKKTRNANRIRRSARLISLLSMCVIATAFSAVSAASESGAILVLDRNSSGSLKQYIPLSEFQFDAATNSLSATTASGSRMCGSVGTTKATGNNVLTLDGVSYAVSSVSVNSSGRRLITVRPAGSSLFPVCSVAASRATVSSQPTQVKSAGRLKRGATLEFEIDVLNDNGSESDLVLPIDGNITYNIFDNPQTLGIDLQADVICLSSSMSPGVRVDLMDTNGIVTGYTGMDELNYFPTAFGTTAERTFKVTTGNNVQCFAPQAVADVVTTGAPPSMCAPTATIFSDGFEDGGVGGGTDEDDLQLDFRLISHPNTSTGDNAVYDLVITNCGPSTLNDVVVKDFYPTGLSAAPTLAQNSSWTCTQGIACSGTGYIDQNIGNLTSGNSVTIRADRALDSGVAAQIIRVDAAAWPVGGQDNDVADNLGAWSFDVRDNLLPVVSIVGTADGLTEDQAPTTITGVTIGASDADGTVSSVNVTSLDTSIATVSNVDDTDKANVLVEVTLVSDANGTVDLEVIATDNLGGQSAPMNVTLNVAAVNDPPSIQVAGGFDYTALQNVPDPVVFTGPCDQDSVAGCADQLFPSSISDQGGFSASNANGFGNWVISVDPGAANESSQTPNISVSISAPSNPGMYFGGPFEPQLSDKGGSWDLIYGLNGSSGTSNLTITVDDGEASNNITTFDFAIVVDNTPPVVTVTNGPPDAIAEDAVSAQLTGTGFNIAATDDDGTIFNVSVTSLNQSMIADGDITWNANDLNDIQVSVTPQPNVFGTVDLQIVATDDVGNPSAPETVTVTVDPVNDPPTVVFGTEADLLMNNEVTAFDDMTDTLTINNDSVFASIEDILQLSGDAVMGPLEGGTQVIMSASVAVTDNSDGVLNLAGPPAIDILAGNTISVLNLLLNGGSTGTATLTITVTDDGSGSDTSGQRTLNLVVVD